MLSCARSKICCMVEIVIFYSMFRQHITYGSEKKPNGQNIVCFLNFVMISSLQKCSRQKKVESVPDQERVPEFFWWHFWVSSSNTRKCESAKKTRNKKFLNVHPSGHSISMVWYHLSSKKSTSYVMWHPMSFLEQIEGNLGPDYRKFAKFGI